MARAETQRLKLLYLYDYFHRCTDEDHPASIAAAIRQDRGITFFFIMIFSFVFVLLTPPL